MRAVALAAALPLAIGLSACAAPKSAPPASPAQDDSRERAFARAHGGAGAAEPAAQAPDAPATPPAARPPEPGKPTSPTTPVVPGAARGAYATPPRIAAIQAADRELESSQRELDVAAGDCRNACRALGSMDRAAGRICGLSQVDDEQRRCDEAKQKLYFARDRVKSTCGECPGGPSVERSAPVPSTR